MADSARGLSSAARWARSAGLTSAALLTLAACDLISSPEEDPPKVELTSAAESVAVSDKVLLTASVPMADGAPTHPVTWSATAGALEPIDVHSLAVWFHALDEP